MKIKIFESDFVFNIDLIAENLEDAAWLVRLGANVKKEEYQSHAYAEKDGTFSRYFSFPRKKENISSIK